MPRTASCSAPWTSPWAASTRARVARSVRLLLELGKHRIAVRDLDAGAILLVRTLRYATIPLVIEPLEGDARARFVEELTDMIAAYVLLERPWR